MTVRYGGPPEILADIRGRVAWAGMWLGRQFPGLALFALAAAVLTPAWAQPSTAPTPVLQDMVACTSIVEDVARLSCYDRSIQPLLVGPAEEGAAAHAFSGTGDWTSETFEMQGPWHIAWTSTAVLLTLELRKADNSFLTVAGIAPGLHRTHPNRTAGAHLAHRVSRPAGRHRRRWLTARS